MTPCLKESNCLKESRGIRICGFYLSTGMCSTDEAPWLVIQLFILFCTVALGCNLPWVAPVPCVAWLSAVPGQTGWKGCPCAFGLSAMWKVKQVKQHKVPGYLFRNGVGTGRVLRSSCCGSVVNLVITECWQVSFWVYDLTRIHVVFSFSAAEGTCEHDNATCSVNNILLF